MKSIRLKITIHLNGNHARSAKQLNALKPPIEKGIAASLPDHIAVDTINVTKVVEMRIREQERRAPAPSGVIDGRRERANSGAARLHRVLGAVAPVSVFTNENPTKPRAHR